MADTAAALVIQLSADFKDFKKQMQKATGLFDTEGRKIEKRQAELKKRLSNWSMNFSGLSQVNKALVGLSAAGAVTGLYALTKGALEAASAIGDVATQAGVSVEFLQKMRFAASQSGASFDIMDDALVTLNKSLGDFVNTGGGKAATAFKALGIDKLIKSGDVRNAEDAYNALTKKLATFGSEAQKSAYLAGVLGKESGPKLLQLVNQGAEGLARLQAQAVSLGVVLSTQAVNGAREANDKLDALFKVIKAQGVAAIASLAPQIAHLAEQITNGLPDLIKWVERWAAYFNLIELSPVQKLQQQLDDVNEKLRNADQLKDSAWLNPLGIMSMNIDAKKAELLAKANALKVDLAKALAAQPAAPKAPPAAGRGPALTINDPAGDRERAAALAREEALAMRRAQFLQQTVIDQKTAQAALLAAQNETQVEMLRGTTEYYAAVQKQINDQADSEEAVIIARADKQRGELAKQGTDWAGYADAVRNIEQTLTDDLALAAEERTQRLYEAGPGKLVADALLQSKEQIQAYQDETGALGLTAGALARFQFIHQQLNIARERGLTLSKAQREELEKEGAAIENAANSADRARKAIDRDITAADTFRQGLIDVGLAGLHGFDSLQDAGLRFLETIGEMILQMYVLKPLIESIGGDFGTPMGGGGGGGGLLSSIFSLFEKGGIATPNGPRALKRMAGGGVRRTASIFAEAGPEAAVPLPDGRSIPVDLRMPQASAGAGAAVSVNQYFDLTGAVVTQDLYDEMNNIAARQAQGAVSKFNSDVMPSRVRTLVRDPRRNY